MKHHDTMPATTGAEPLPLDGAAPVRPGEELNQERLAAYLASQLPGLDGPLEVMQFPRGHSNLTYLLRVCGTEFVLRRPPFGSKVKSAHDMGREYTVLSKLCPVYLPAPKPLLYCEDPEILGAPFYLMERVQGVILRSAPPDGFAWGAGQVRACCEAFVRNLAALHAVDYEAVGLGELRRPGQYTRRQVLGWTKRFHASQTGDAPAMDQALNWLARHVPADSGAVLVHNDYKFDNIVLDSAEPSRIAGVLDWEMATIGDPLMDLGCALGYWAEPEDGQPDSSVSCFLTLMPGSMTRAELAGRYAEISGRTVGNFTFYYAFALVRLAVIVQQIYYRYVHGHTQDPRFAPLGGLVQWIAQRALRTIEQGRM